jgi:hypothetical protein
VKSHGAGSGSHLTIPIRTHAAADSPLLPLALNTPTLELVAFVYLIGTVPVIVQPSTLSLQFMAIVPLVTPLTTGDTSVVVYAQLSVVAMALSLHGVYLIVPVTL